MIKIQLNLKYFKIGIKQQSQQTHYANEFFSSDVLFCYQLHLVFRSTKKINTIYNL